MDEQTALVLTIQLLALFSIAGALLLYLLCKIKTTGDAEAPGGSLGSGRPVLVTSADTAFGLQVAVHLADVGFRVFAGLRNGAAAGAPGDSASSRVIRAWQKHRESLQPGLAQGALIALPLDVTREDLLHEAIDIIRAHLPAGEDGLWAVVNTSSVALRGRIDQQDISHWDAMLKTNVVGVFRTARTFLGLLRNTRNGRILNVGAAESCGAGLVAYTASRYAVEGGSEALRQELAPLGVKVITLRLLGVSAEHMCAPPRLSRQQQQHPAAVSVDMGCVEYHPRVLSDYALQLLDHAVTTGMPENSYKLKQKFDWLKPLNLFAVHKY